MIRVFFDASVIFSALYSSVGASFALIDQAQNFQITLLTTQTVIDELLAHSDKIPGFSVEKFRLFITDRGFIVRERVTAKELLRFQNITSDPHDTHIIAGASLTNAAFLVTLDKKHIYTPEVQAKIENYKIVLPRELLFQLKNN